MSTCEPHSWVFLKSTFFSCEPVQGLIPKSQHEEMVTSYEERLREKDEYIADITAECLSVICLCRLALPCHGALDLPSAI